MSWWPLSERAFCGGSSFMKCYLLNSVFVSETRLHHNNVSGSFDLTKFCSLTILTWKFPCQFYFSFVTIRPVKTLSTCHFLCPNAEFSMFFPTSFNFFLWRAYKWCTNQTQCINSAKQVQNALKEIKEWETSVVAMQRLTIIAYENQNNCIPRWHA